MIRVGVIGLGFMGGVHLKNWQSLADVQVIAICDSAPVDRTAKKGNIDAGSAALDLAGIHIYTDVAEMLAKEALDAVSIALPTYLHRKISTQCLEAGVHVLCEKPMALTVADCDAMIAASEKAGKHLMVAHCIRFWPEYVWVKNAVISGEFGKVISADFERLTAAPAWAEGSWLSDADKSGGIALDLHIHDLDYIQYILGTPDGIGAVSSRPKHIQSWVKYADDLVVSATASWMMPESFGFQMSFRIVFETAAVVFDGAELKVFPSDAEMFKPDLETADGYQKEIEYFASLVSGSQKNTLIPPEEARESVRMALEVSTS